MGFARLYARLRVGKLFLIILCVFCGGWVAWNLLPWTPHFDEPGFSRLTLILSVEASIATSVLMASTEKQDELQRKQLVFMLHLMEAIHAQLTHPDSAARSEAAAPPVANGADHGATPLAPPDGDPDS